MSKQTNVEPPKAAAPAPSPQLVEVRVAPGAEVVSGDKVRKAGELIRLDHQAAEMLVAAGRAAWTVPIKALEPVLTGATMLAAGDVAEVHEEVAIRLHNGGWAEVLDRSKLCNPGALQVPKPRPKKPAPPDPFAGIPKVNCHVVEPFLFGQTTLSKGSTVALPEPIAERSARAGKVSILPGQTMAKGRAELFRTAGP